jgi:diaminopropionate ammonia-lyase
MNGMTDYKWIDNHRARAVGSKTSVEFLGADVAEKVKRFHMSFPQYSRTPLHFLDELAKCLGLGEIWIKDESYRFGLNAFKVLGGSYAIGSYIADAVGMDESEMTFEALRSKDTVQSLGETVFVTATDGNHGRGVAWAARELGHRSVVFMPKGSAQMRLDNIRNEGAEASITEYNYDDAVRYATEFAKQNGGVIVQDTAWHGYEKIPTWIMQGYTTIAAEIEDQLREKKSQSPTHVFLQAGVGSFAAAIQGYYAALYQENRPMTVIIEPNAADCFYRSALSEDGGPVAVTGPMETIMAGLACGEPNTIGWEILRDYGDHFVSCPDLVSARGMRILANPVGNDPKVISGESGAVGLGLLSLLMERPEWKESKQAMGLDETSRVVIISTEGDTDVRGYRDVVWDGAYPSR